MTPVILFVIFLALLIDFLNGFHGAANSIDALVSMAAYHLVSLGGR